MVSESPSVESHFPSAAPACPCGVLDETDDLTAKETP
jgi:hypothetical protein